MSCSDSDNNILLETGDRKLRMGRGRKSGRGRDVGAGNDDSFDGSRGGSSSRKTFSPGEKANRGNRGRGMNRGGAQYREPRGYHGRAGNSENCQMDVKNGAEHGWQTQRRSGGHSGFSTGSFGVMGDADSVTSSGSSSPENSAKKSVQLDTKQDFRIGAGKDNTATERELQVSCRRYPSHDVLDKAPKQHLNNVNDIPPVARRSSAMNVAEDDGTTTAHLVSSGGCLRASDANLDQPPLAASRQSLRSSAMNVAEDDGTTTAHLYSSRGCLRASDANLDQPALAASRQSLRSSAMNVAEDDGTTTAHLYSSRGCLRASDANLDQPALAASRQSLRSSAMNVAEDDGTTTAHLYSSRGCLRASDANLDQPALATSRQSLRSSAMNVAEDDGTTTAHLYSSRGCLRASDANLDQPALAASRQSLRSSAMNVAEDDGTTTAHLYSSRGCLRASHANLDQPALAASRQSLRSSAMNVAEDDGTTTAHLYSSRGCLRASDANLDQPALAASRQSLRSSAMNVAEDDGTTTAHLYSSRGCLRASDANLDQPALAASRQSLRSSAMNVAEDDGTTTAHLYSSRGCLRASDANLDQPALATSRQSLRSSAMNVAEDDGTTTAHLYSSRGCLRASDANLHQPALAASRQSLRSSAMNVAEDDGTTTAHLYSSRGCLRASDANLHQPALAASRQSLRSSAMNVAEDGGTTTAHLYSSRGWLRASDANLDQPALAASRQSLRSSAMNVAEDDGTTTAHLHSSRVCLRASDANLDQPALAASRQSLRSSAMNVAEDDGTTTAHLYSSRGCLRASDANLHQPALAASRQSLRSSAMNVAEDDGTTTAHLYSSRGCLRASDANLHQPALAASRQSLRSSAMNVAEDGGTTTAHLYSSRGCLRASDANLDQPALATSRQSLRSSAMNVAEDDGTTTAHLYSSRVCLRASDANLDQPPLATSRQSLRSSAMNVAEDDGTTTAHLYSSRGCLRASDANLDQPALAASRQSLRSSAMNVAEDGGTTTAHLYSSRGWLRASDANLDQPALAASRQSLRSSAMNVAEDDGTTTAHLHSSRVCLRASDANLDQPPLAASRQSLRSSAMNVAEDDGTTTAHLHSSRVCLRASDANLDQPALAASRQSLRSSAMNVAEDDGTTTAHLYSSRVCLRASDANLDQPPLAASRQSLRSSAMNVAEDDGTTTAHLHSSRVCLRASDANLDQPALAASRQSLRSSAMNVAEDDGTTTAHLHSSRVCLRASDANLDQPALAASRQSLRSSAMNDAEDDGTTTAQLYSSRGCLRASDANLDQPPLAASRQSLRSSAMNVAEDDGTTTAHLHSSRVCLRASDANLDQPALAAFRQSLRSSAMNVAEDDGTTTAHLHSSRGWLRASDANLDQPALAASRQSLEADTWRNSSSKMKSNTPDIPARKSMSNTSQGLTKKLPRSRSTSATRRNEVHFSSIPQLHSHPDDRFGIPGEGKSFRPTAEHNRTPCAQKSKGEAGDTTNDVSQTAVHKTHVDLDTQLMTVPVHNTDTRSDSEMDPPSRTPSLRSIDMVPPALVVTNAITPKRAPRDFDCQDDYNSPAGFNRTHFTPHTIQRRRFKEHPAPAVLTAMLQQRQSKAAGDHQPNPPVTTKPSELDENCNELRSDDWTDQKYRLSSGDEIPDRRFLLEKGQDSHLSDQVFEEREVIVERSDYYGGRGHHYTAQQVEKTSINSDKFGGHLPLIGSPKMRNLQKYYTKAEKVSQHAEPEPVEERRKSNVITRETVEQLRQSMKTPSPLSSPSSRMMHRQKITTGVSPFKWKVADVDIHREQKEPDARSNESRHSGKGSTVSVPSGDASHGDDASTDSRIDLRRTSTPLISHVDGDFANAFGRLPPIRSPESSHVHESRRLESNTTGNFNNAETVTVSDSRDPAAAGTTLDHHYAQPMVRKAAPPPQRLSVIHPNTTQHAHYVQHKRSQSDQPTYTRSYGEDFGGNTMIDGRRSDQIEEMEQVHGEIDRMFEFVEISGYRDMQRIQRAGRLAADVPPRFSPLTAPTPGIGVSTYKSREGTIGEKKLNHQIRVQEEQIEMTLKVLALARKKQKSMQELSAQRTLLLARERLELLRCEVNRISALAAVRNPPPPVSRDLRGTMTISNITVHLNRSFCQHQYDHDTSYALLILLKCGAEVEATGPISLLAHQQTRIRHLTFAEHVQFANLPVDFNVVVEVYAMKLPTPKEVEQSCASNIANKCRNLLSPALTTRPGRALCRADSQVSEFVRCGYIILNRDTVGANKFYLDEAEYPLEGIIEVYARCTTLPPAIEVDNRGFLTMYQTVSGMASWERYWSVLRRGMVYFWRYPDDESLEKRPVAFMDLSKCTNDVVVACTPEQCPPNFSLSYKRMLTWSSRNQKSYQRIDDEYDDGDQRAGSINSILPIVNAARHTMFSGPSNTESSPLISGSSTPGDGYQSPPSSHVVGLSAHDDTERTPPVMSSSSRHNDHRWDHIENLDRFFTLVYEYHQGGGFLTVAVKKVFSLVQFLFVVSFSTFFMQCVDYDVLFANKNVTTTGEPITGKRSFNDAVVANCASHLHPLVVFSILVAIVFWILRVVKATYYLLELHEIQLFYRSALLINDAQLPNLTWQAVVQRICEVQKHLHLKVDRDHITPFDLYNRILRFKNYFVALVNTRVLPPVINVPFLHAVPYFPNGLKSNLRRILFFGSTSPWAGPYLKEEYKDLDNLELLTRQMEKDVAMYGFLNLIFFPLIFLYHILYSFFMLSELIKRRPDALGMRRYSNYGRYRVRHFNELNHELGTRLNRSHQHANAYLDQFNSALVETFAKNIAFIAGAIAGVLAILSAWDEDVLQIEHVLTVISVCGVIMVVCHGIMSDENLVWQPEALMTHIASELHYVPPEWKGQAHTQQVRREFEQLFQLKWVFLLQELSSPILTPFILLFWIRPKCRELVRFFHDNTVRVDGLGDVCSFALMDIARHGDVNWNGSTSRPSATPAMDGKTELSVLHFASNNPDWRCPPATEQFLRRFRSRLEHDFNTAVHPDIGSTERNLLLDSMHSLIPPAKSAPFTNAILGDGLYRADAPPDSIVCGLLPTLYQNNPEAAYSLTRSIQQSGIDLDTAGADMRIKSLFLRNMRDEGLRRSSAPIAGYGTSMAPPQAQSVFGVPQLSQMEESMMPESDARSRLVLRSNLAGTSEEEADVDGRREDDDDDDNDNAPPPQFIDV
ncbi:hypothetical protein Q1695_004652 [Nippostrongylus brasiliensis]|nr:hypothetical protein Q1695_004652 [Nippostrongylus brasiliensis]